MGNRTPFYDLHIKSQAKMVDFAGYDMPLHYGSQVNEHHLVRRHAGMFDVSHMGVVDIAGTDAKAFLERLLANHVGRLVDGKALYTCMLNDQGGVIDDLIVYKLEDESYRLVVNAGTRAKDLAWMNTQLGSFNVTIKERTDLVMLAIQGPEVKDKLKACFKPSDVEALQQLKPFHFLQINHLFIARTGYTGEDGYEMIFPKTEAEKYWQLFLDAGIKPCGLGARDTLRLEAGLNLYGLDMDETVTPLESNLAWTVVMDPKERNFIGREALEKQLAQGVKHRLVGVILEGPGIMRSHQRVITDSGVGEVTSGGYSPTLEKSIGFARVPANVGSNCLIEIRQKEIQAQMVKPPFVRYGKSVLNKSSIGEKS